MIKGQAVANESIKTLTYPCQYTHWGLDNWQCSFYKYFEKYTISCLERVSNHLRDLRIFWCVSL